MAAPHGANGMMGLSGAALCGFSQLCSKPRSRAGRGWTEVVFMLATSLAKGSRCRWALPARPPGSLGWAPGEQSWPAVAPLAPSSPPSLVSESQRCQRRELAVLPLPTPDSGAPAHSST